MVAALSFLLDYEKIQDGEDSDNSDSEDEVNPQNIQVALSKEAVYKAHNKGTQSSKKKKKAKLQRAMRSLKRQQRLSSEKTSTAYYSPLNHLNDAQGFAEKLFSRLQSCNERFEVKMMMLKVIARTIGLHGLIVLNFYPFLQKYVQPHQRDITNLLAAAVQACHDMVPPDAVEPMFRQIVNQFVHDRSRTEAIAVGLNVVREICLRMPLLMTEELLQDLVLYKKSHEKAVSAAARSLITLFREICPSLLIKKDRGRPTDPKAKPKAYGERTVTSNVPGVELLLEHDNEIEHDRDYSGSEGEMVGDSETSETDDIDERADDGDDNDTISVPDDVLVGSDSDVDADDIINTDDEDEVDDDEEEEEDEEGGEEEDEDTDQDDNEETEGYTSMGSDKEGSCKVSKRKLVDFDANLLSAESSLRTLKKLASDAKDPSPLNPNDGILSNEDFERIKQLKARKDAKIALGQRGVRKGSDAGLKVPTQDQLRIKRVDAAELMAHMKEKLTKEQRLAHVREGREGREKYQARAAVKQKKTGGLSNRQKEHKKAMPLAAKRSKIAKSREEKKRKNGRSSKQFRGKKAWK
uniref:Protein SDA1 n=1 Tax=Kalanchoe fedtschenkoi TaxID=63787 RepID=A0A7N0UR20_KALFE